MEKCLPMTSSALYPLIRSAPMFHVEISPVGVSMKIPKSSIYSMNDEKMLSIENRSEREEEGRTFSGVTFGPKPSTVALNNAKCGGKADARSGKLAG